MGEKAPDTAMSLPPVTCLQVVPCLRVTSCVALLHTDTSLPQAVAFYTTVLGFARVGSADATQARLFRGALGAASTTPGVHLVLRLPPLVGDDTRDEVHPQMLWLSVNSVDGAYKAFPADAAFFNEVTTNMESATRLNGYFPEHHFGSARIASRPQTTAWKTREFSVIDMDGNALIITEAR